MEEVEVEISDEVFDKVGVQCRHTFSGHSGQILCVVALSDSKLATGGCYTDKTIRVWDVHSGELVARLAGFSSACLTLEGLSEQHMCSGHENGDVLVWDFMAGTLQHTLAGRWKHKAPVVAMCRLSGTYLATAGNCADRYIRIWNWAKRNDCLHILKPNVEFELDGHEEKIVLGPTKRGVRVAQIVDIGKGVIACTEWSSINLWSWKDAQLLSSAPLDDATSIRPLLHLGRGMAATAGRSGTILIYRLKDGEVARSMKGHTRPVWGLFSLTDTMDYLASGSLDGTIRVWKWRNCGSDCDYQCLTAIPVGPIVGPANIVPIGAHYIACGGEDEFIRIFSWRAHGPTPAGTLVARLEGHIDTITQLTALPASGPTKEQGWTSNKLMFASASEDQEIKIWQVAKSSLEM